MSLPVVLRPEARVEFDEAFDWYEQRRLGLGVDFVAQVQEVFDSSGGHNGAFDRADTGLGKR